MNLLIGINNWDVGGAENFVFDLVKNLSKQGHSVSLFIMYNHGFYKDKLDKLFGAEREKIKIVNRFTPSKRLDHILWILNGLGIKLGFDNIRGKLIDKLSRISLNRYLKRAKIEVVNTHLFETDEFISSNINLPHIVSMHGPYETYLDSDNEYGRRNDKGLNEGFIERAVQVLKKAKNIIYVADKNLEICKHFNSAEIHTEKIYYGYSNVLEPKPGNRAENDTFTFGMVARGVEAKGWEIAIKSFIKLNQTAICATRLQLLYTLSPYMSDLKNQYTKYENIDFVGFVEGEEKHHYQSNFDATLLPTYDDCLPVSIIESLKMSVPVISTDVGEIPNMLESDNKFAGIILPLIPEENKPSVEELADAMKEYIEDKKLYADHKINTKLCAQKFDMGNCISEYIEVFKKAINRV